MHIVWIFWGHGMSTVKFHLKSFLKETFQKNQNVVLVPSIEGGRHPTVNLGFVPDSQPKNNA